MIQCENCGYPVMNGMHYCPNCDAEVSEIVEKEEIPQTEGITYDEDEMPICTLRPMQQPGEKTMREESYDEGAEVMLSRDNTVPHDMSIDDELQACLFFAEGHWWIEDRSRDNTTFVHAGAGIKLEPGDIIRMGDREFEFNIKTRKK